MITKNIGGQMDDHSDKKTQYAFYMWVMMYYTPRVSTLIVVKLYKC